MKFSKRKWGWYLTLIEREHFKVKILRFHQSKACSFQSHKQRAELWLFLTGEGEFTKDLAKMNYKRGDYATVGRHIMHKFHATKSTYVLEIQYGTKCEEKDITRYD